MFGHGIKCTAILEPFYLSFIECLRELDFERGSILRVDSEGHWLSHSKFCDHQIDLILRVDLIVVCGVGESKGQHALLFEIGLML